MEINGINVTNIKYRNIKIEGVNPKMVINSGSSTNVIDYLTFKRIEQSNSNIKLTKTVSKLYPYASELLKVIGYFNALMETKNRMCSEKVFVVEQAQNSW